MDNPTNSVYRDGRFIVTKTAELSLEDYGFVWGATVTDRCRTYLQKWFRLDDHIARFRNSCALCRIPLSATDREIASAADDLLERQIACAATGTEFTLIMLATPGTQQSPSIILQIQALDFTKYRPLIEIGAKLVIPATHHVPDDCIPRHAKMRSRMHWWIAEKEAQSVEPSAHALLLDSDGVVTETAAANVAIVRNGVIFTPPLERVLPGISRRVLVEIAASLEIPLREAPFTAADCETSDEMWLLSTPFAIAGVVSLNGRRFNWPGPLVQRIRGVWSQLTGVDIWLGLEPKADAC
jgi:branched-subunit amino acid aminotransferase/4-amino-4-deoxychorismate lyase